MGLKIHSLVELPANAERKYYIYLLDYGWNEPLGNALRDNFDKMAELSSKNNAVVLQGTRGEEFSDEVLSWHSVNGQSGEDILPAILITTRHPRNFRDERGLNETRSNWSSDRLVLIPLKKVCKSSTDVVELIERLFRDIGAQKQLSGFQVARELSRGKHRAVVDALILEPNFMGIGINFNYLLNFLLGRREGD